MCLIATATHFHSFIFLVAIYCRHLFLLAASACFTWLALFVSSGCRCYLQLAITACCCTLPPIRTTSRHHFLIFAAAACCCSQRPLEVTCCKGLFPHSPLIGPVISCGLYPVAGHASNFFMLATSECYCLLSPLVSGLCSYLILLLAPTCCCLILSPLLFASAANYSSIFCIYAPFFHQMLSFSTAA